jgi:microcystin degradation protein MlrC
MGSGALVVTDNDPQAALAIAQKLACLYWDRRQELEPQVFSVADAIRASLQQPGAPIVLVETADCCGGGAAGDSVWALRGLLEFAPAQPALVPIVDAEAAQAAHAAGIGGTLNIPLGHKHDPRWGSPVSVVCRVARLGDGTFRYDGGIWDGVQGNMGKCAVLEVGNIQVLATSHGTYDWKHEQFDAMGLEPAKAKFIVAKNPMNYRQAYGEIAAATYILDTPGPTPASLRNVSFKQLQRPYFPADQSIPELQPTILRSRRCSDGFPSRWQ